MVLARVWRNWNLGILLVGMQNDVAIMQTVPFFNKLKGGLPYGLTITYLIEVGSGSKRWWRTHVYGRIFHSSQEMGATWVSRDGWMHNEDVACDNNRILFSLGIWKWLATHWKSVLLNATTRMESQGILLREASHEKMRTKCFHLHAERKEVELRNREVVARCWGWLSVDVEV